jgi:hypothetical protein
VRQLVERFLDDRPVLRVGDLAFVNVVHDRAGVGEVCVERASHHFVRRGAVRARHLGAARVLRAGHVAGGDEAYEQHEPGAYDERPAACGENRDAVQQG